MLTYHTNYKEELTRPSPKYIVHLCKSVIILRTGEKCIGKHDAKVSASCSSRMFLTSQVFIYIKIQQCTRAKFLLPLQNSQETMTTINIHLDIFTSNRTRNSLYTRDSNKCQYFSKSSFKDSKSFRLISPN